MAKKIQEPTVTHVHFDSRLTSPMPKVDETLTSNAASRKEAYDDAEAARLEEDLQAHIVRGSLDPLERKAMREIISAVTELIYAKRGSSHLPQWIKIGTNAQHMMDNIRK